MADNDWLAEQFEAKRGHLRGVAYRMLGALAEADDAVQEAWLRLSRSGGSGVDNLGSPIAIVFVSSIWLCSLSDLRRRHVRAMPD